MLEGVGRPRRLRRRRPRGGAARRQGRRVQGAAPGHLEGHGQQRQQVRLPRRVRRLVQPAHHGLRGLQGLQARRGQGVDLHVRAAVPHPRVQSRQRRWSRRSGRRGTSTACTRARRTRARARRAATSTRSRPRTRTVAGRRSPRAASCRRTASRRPWAPSPSRGRGPSTRPTAGPPPRATARRRATSSGERASSRTRPAARGAERRRRRPARVRRTVSPPVAGSTEAAGSFIPLSPLFSIQARPTSPDHVRLSGPSLASSFARGIEPSATPRLSCLIYALPSLGEVVVLARARCKF